MQKGLTYDDVLLVPQYSDIKSRSEVSLTTEFGRGVELGLPIIASPMDTVSEADMAGSLGELGGISIVHRYNSIEEQSAMIASLGENTLVGAAVGVSGDFADRAISAVAAGAKVICIDVAHGHHELSLFVVKTLRHMFDDVFIIAGNVATLDGFEALADAGADAVRVGIGGGAVCSTRVVTGHGIPTLQSVADCSGSARTCYIIADGGIKNTGDIVKSFAAGADFVMLGSMLAGKKESPGETKTVEGVVYKNYRGMASASAQMDWRGRVSVAEGVDSWRPVSESIEETVDLIVAGVRSGLSYSGCESLDEFHGVAEFVRITPASMKESVPHAVGVIF